MWPFVGMSLSMATLIGSIANWALLVCLLGGVLATFVIVQTADVKEDHWDDARKHSNERIAELNNETARLQADNLALQTVLLPRSAGSIGINQRAPAEMWFAGLQNWAGTKLLIQVIPGDAEAQNLANEIAIIVSQFGWHPELIDQKRSGVSLSLREGLEVMSPSSYKAWDPKDSTFRKLGDAARALATGLTNARLGVGPYPVSGLHGLSMTVDFPPDSPAAMTNPFRNFSPPLDGVYLQIGARPVAATLQWIRQGRPDETGIVHHPSKPIENDR